MVWFALDIDRYEEDTIHLSPAEDGIYGRLIRHYYRTRLPLPDNDRALAAIARIGIDEWMNARSIVRAFFQPHKGLLYQKRCDKELEMQDKGALGRSKKARRAAEIRWNKNNDIDAMSIQQASSEHAPSNAQAMLGDATLTLTDSKKEDSVGIEPTGAPSGAPIDLKSILFGSVREWLIAKTGKRDQAIRTWLGKLCRDFGDGESLEVCQQAARAGPVDPFPWIIAALKQRKSGNGKNRNGYHVNKSEEFARGVAKALIEIDAVDEQHAGEEGVGSDHKRLF